MILRALGLSFALALPVVAAADGIGPGTPIPPDITIGLPDSPTTPDMIDSAWGSSGYVTFTDQSITAKALDTNRRLLIAGQSGNGSLVRRLLVNGQPDTSFGNNGSLAISLGSSTLKDRPVVIIPLADGSFYLLINHDRDTTLPDAPRNHSLVYVSASGNITGINEGVRFTQEGFGIDVIRDTEGRLYPLSTTGDNSFRMEWTLQRLLPDGSLDTSFGNDGAIHWYSNQASVIGMFAGDQVQARYFDPLNTCQVRALYIAENGDTTDQCADNADSRPTAVFSVPSLEPSEIESVVYTGMTQMLNTLEPFTPADESLSYNAYPLGFLNIIRPTQIQLGIFTPLYSSTLWSLDSPELLALTTNNIGTKARPDADGGVFISFNTDAGDNGYDQLYSPPATVFRSKGFTLDTLPDPVGSPSISVSDDYYISSPITITGLGEYVSVPVRITGGEISLDDINWYKGWVWVHNENQVKVRYSNTATLTIGGIISPNNPSLPVGDVLTMSFNQAVTNPDLSPVEPGSSSGGGSGGSADLSFLMLAGLLALLKARKKPAAPVIH